MGASGGASLPLLCDSLNLQVFCPTVSLHTALLALLANYQIDLAGLLYVNEQSKITVVLIVQFLSGC